MDLEKDSNREAFEAFFYENCMFQWEQDLSEMFFQVLENNEYDYARVQSSWLSWQAAKAHEAEKLKGCVMVPVELSEEAIYKINDSLAFQDEESVRYAWHEMVEAANRGND